MGGVISDISQRQNEMTDLPPIPPPRIMESPGIIPAGIALPVERPPEVTVVKQGLAFNLLGETLRWTDVKHPLSITFKYFSSIPISAVLYLADRAPAAVGLPPTREEELDDAILRFPEGYTLAGIEAGNSAVKLRLTDSEDYIDFDLIFNSSDIKFTKASVFRKAIGHEVQIFTLFTNSRGPGSPDSTSGACCICLSSPARVGFIPCRHVSVCNDCVDGIFETASRHCPICRSPIRGLLRL